MMGIEKLPSPSMGEGAGDGGERLRHAPGAVKRARRLRREMTLAEKLLWAELRKLDAHIRRQAPIGRYIADFACHETKLVIEVDSERHDLPESQFHDAVRTQWLMSQGYRVLRFRNGDIFEDLGTVVAGITAACSPSSPTPSPIKGEGR